MRLSWLQNQRCRKKISLFLPQGLFRIAHSSRAPNNASPRSARVVALENESAQYFLRFFESIEGIAD